MVRALPLLSLFVILAMLLVARPDLPLRLLARLWFAMMSSSSFDPQVPRWVFHYRWSAPGDPVPPETQALEDFLRLLGAVIMAPVVLVLIILVFNS